MKSVSQPSFALMAAMPRPIQYSWSAMFILPVLEPLTVKSISPMAHSLSDFGCVLNWYWMQVCKLSRTI